MRFFEMDTFVRRVERKRDRDRDKILVVICISFQFLYPFLFSLTPPSLTFSLTGTGDLVRLNPQSKRITILGRSNAAMITKTNHVVFPSKLESTFETQSSLVDRILVVASSEYDEIVAVVVPSFLEKSEYDEKMIRNDFVEIATRLNMSSEDIPRRIHVSSTNWTISNGLLAGNTKIIRKKIFAFYRKEIEAMFSSMSV